MPATQDKVLDVLVYVGPVNGEAGSQRETPWWASWSRLRMVGHRLEGISSRHPYTMKLSSMLRWSLTLQNFFRDSGRSALGIHGEWSLWELDTQSPAAHTSRLMEVLVFRIMKGGCSDLCKRHGLRGFSLTSHSLHLLFRELIITVWWRAWECIRCSILGAFLPFCCKPVCHDACSQTL